MNHTAPKEIVLKEMGHLIIVEQFGLFGVIAEGGVEDVEGAVVVRRRHVIHVILHFHLAAENVKHRYCQHRRGRHHRFDLNAVTLTVLAELDRAVSGTSHLIIQRLRRHRRCCC